jgi:hypothetical protein
MFNWLLRKIYNRKNNFLKVYCLHCCAQIDLIESVVDWIRWKRVRLTPRWLLKRQLAKIGLTAGRLEELKQDMLKMIEDYKTKNQKV